MINRHFAVEKRDPRRYPSKKTSLGLGESTIVRLPIIIEVCGVVCRRKDPKLGESISAVLKGCLVAVVVRAKRMSRAGHPVVMNIF